MQLVNTESPVYEEKVHIFGLQILWDYKIRIHTLEQNQKQDKGILLYKILHS